MAYRDMLGEDLDAVVTEAAHQLGTTKADVVRRALHVFFATSPLIEITSQKVEIPEGDATSEEGP